MAAPRKPRSTDARSTATAKAGGARRSGTRTTAKRGAAKQERDGEGRFTADHHVRNAAFGATAVLGAVAAGVAAAFKFGLLDRFLPRSEGHAAEDLLIDRPAASQRGPAADRRAAKDFRPDIEAPMSAAEREALRPPKSNRAPADVESVIPV